MIKKHDFNLYGSYLQTNYQKLYDISLMYEKYILQIQSI